MARRSSPIGLPMTGGGAGVAYLSAAVHRSYWLYLPRYVQFQENADLTLFRRIAQKKLPRNPPIFDIRHWYIFRPFREWIKIHRKLFTAKGNGNQKTGTEKN